MLVDARKRMAAHLVAEMNTTLSASFEPMEAALEAHDKKLDAIILMVKELKTGKKTNRSIPDSVKKVKKIKAVSRDDKNAELVMRLRQTKGGEALINSLRDDEFNEKMRVKAMNAGKLQKGADSSDFE